jgi:hypothetical protein
MHEVRKLVENGGERSDIVVRKAAHRSEQRKTGGLSAIAIPRQECRRTNQRRDGRHSNLIDEAVITFRRKRTIVQVVNVSCHGVMIRSDIEPRLGERMDIQFEDCNRTTCYVRWVKAGQIGIEFARETVLIMPPHAADSAPGGRRAGEQPPRVEIKRDRPDRHSLLLRGVLHAGIESVEVRLRNISAEGAMLDCAEDFLIGTPIVLELAGGGALAIAGCVRWCLSGQIGVLFDAPFDMQLLADGGTAQHAKTSLPNYVKPDYLTSEGEDDSPWAARTYGLRPQDL